MGRLTIEETQSLINVGILNQDALVELQNRGLVGKRRKSKEKDYVLNIDNVKVYPALTFKGHGKGNQDSNVMQSIRNEFNNIINKYKENK
jgi:hypothetical protein